MTAKNQRTFYLDELGRVTVQGMPLAALRGVKAREGEPPVDAFEAKLADGSAGPDSPELTIHPAFARFTANCMVSPRLTVGEVEALSAETRAQLIVEIMRANPETRRLVRHIKAAEA